MPQYPREEIRGSLWGRGRIGFIVGAALIVFLLVRVPAIRWFLGISLLVGLVMWRVIAWYNAHTPVKTADEDKVVLHLNDDEDVRR